MCRDGLRCAVETGVKYSRGVDPLSTSDVARRQIVDDFEGEVERLKLAGQRRQRSSRLTELAAVFDEPALSVSTETYLLKETVCVDARRRTK